MKYFFTRRTKELFLNTDLKNVSLSLSYDPSFDFFGSGNADIFSATPDISGGNLTRENGFAKTVREEED